MSQNDKPKLDELQKLLRRLERVEQDKADLPSSEDVPKLAGETAPSDPSQSLATKNVISNSANAIAATGPATAGADTVRLGAASGGSKSAGDALAGRTPGDPKFIEKLQSGLGAPSQTRSGGGQQAPALEHGKDAENIRDRATPETNGSPLDARKAASKPDASADDKQHLARMVYRGTPRELPRENGVPGSNGPQGSGTDQSPFQLPALPDTRSREISEAMQDKARSGSSIGVVLVAAITAAMVSTIAAVLITIWVIRGGGFGGQSDPVLDASRSAPPIVDTGSSAVSTADAAGAKSIGTSTFKSSPIAAGSVEPLAVEQPPDAAKLSAEEAVDGPAKARKIAAAIASDQPVADGQGSPPGASSQAGAAELETSGEQTVAEKPEGPSTPVDLAAITNTAPEPDRSEMVSASIASEPQTGRSDTQPEASSGGRLQGGGNIADDGGKDAAQISADQTSVDQTSVDVADDRLAPSRPSGDPSDILEREAGSQLNAQAPSEASAEPSVTSSEALSAPLEGPDNPENTPTGRLAESAAGQDAGPSLAGDALAAGAAASSAAEPATKSTDAAADAPGDETSAPAAGRGDALAFNATTPEGDLSPAGQTAGPANSAQGQQSDSALVPQPDSAAAFTPPKPRAPYSLNNPTQLEIAPDASFEFPLSIDAPSTARLDNHFLIVSGLKRGARFSQGVELMFDTWQVQANNLNQLRLTIPAGFARELPLTIELRRPDGMTVVRTRILLTTPGSVDRLNLPPALFEKESQALPAAVLAKVREGERAIDNGNLRGARLALQEAALQSSAVAALLLAMSYDPRHSAKFGDATGSNANIAAARQWYGRASSFGAEIAKTISRGL